MVLICASFQVCFCLASTSASNPDVMIGYYSNYTVDFADSEPSQYFKTSYPVDSGETGYTFIAFGHDPVNMHLGEEFKLTLSKNPDYSYPWFQTPSFVNNQFVVWQDDPNFDVYMNLTIDSEYSARLMYSSGRVDKETWSVGEINEDEKEAYYVIETSGAIWDQYSTIGFAYSFDLIQGHEYDFRLGDDDWDMPESYTSFDVYLMHAPVAKYDYQYGYCWEGPNTGIANISTYFTYTGDEEWTGISDFECEASGTYVLISTQQSQIDWVPSRLKIIDKSYNAWEEALDLYPQLKSSIAGFDHFILISLIGIIGIGYSMSKRR